MWAVVNCWRCCVPHQGLWVCCLFVRIKLILWLLLFCLIHLGLVLISISLFFFLFLMALCLLILWSNLLLTAANFYCLSLFEATAERQEVQTRGECVTAAVGTLCSPATVWITSIRFVQDSGVLLKRSFCFLCHIHAVEFISMTKQSVTASFCWELCCGSYSIKSVRGNVTFLHYSTTIETHCRYKSNWLF